MSDINVGTNPRRGGTGEVVRFAELADAALENRGSWVSMKSTENGKYDSIEGYRQIGRLFGQASCKNGRIYLRIRTEDEL